MPGPLPPRCALVIEDGRAIRELLRLHLELGGFALVETGDGRHALDLTRETRFDIILLDVMLPSLDGVSAEKPPSDTLKRAAL